MLKHKEYNVFISNPTQPPFGKVATIADCNIWEGYCRGFFRLTNPKKIFKQTDNNTLKIVSNNINYDSLYKKPIMSTISQIIFQGRIIGPIRTFPPNIKSVLFFDLNVIDNNISYIHSWPSSSSICYENNGSNGYDVIIKNFINVIQLLNTSLPLPIYEEIIVHLSVDEDNYDDIFVI